LRWKYLKIALIGALLGFLGQFLFDFFTPNIDVDYHGHRQKDSAFQIFCSMHGNSKLCAEDQNLVMQCIPLFFQALTLIWLSESSEGALRTAAISALLLVAIVQSIEHLKRNKLMANNS
jgi:hypothetical protein